MQSGNNFYITTPIYYVNDKPHIGHAYTSLACDVMARFKRLDGYNVYFLTGTDEHGQKVEKAANAKGVKPKDFTDEVSARFSDLAQFMNYSNDDFIRTTQERHYKAAQALWEKLIEKGDIYLDAYEGWYAVRDEAFYMESDTEVRDGIRYAKESGAEVEWLKEESYFFKLSAYQDKLLDYYEKHPDFIMPKSRRNEVISFVNSGLHDLSVSRASFKWGIPVPNNKNHVMYVWLDALANYLTVLGYPDTESEKFKQFWPANVHMVGKDIIRFHAVYWPAFLMAAGLALPQRIFAHGWWTNEGEKISKSVGNVIDPIEIVNEYGLDSVRYFMLREVPFGNDGDFSKSSMVNRINSELSNEYGNLAQRVFSMIYKNCEGKIPAHKGLTDEDKALLNQCNLVLEEMRKKIDKQSFTDAIEAVWKLIRAANQYVDIQAPWALKKTDSQRMETVLWVLAETIRNITLLLQPVMPQSTGKILDYLSIASTDRDFAMVGDVGQLKEGLVIDKPEPIFPRYITEE
ncbi:MAG: methionine--tRNA ligase [Alphaproteobacteria bacterium]